MLERLRRVLGFAVIAFDLALIVLGALVVAACVASLLRLVFGVL